jgi:hypothetical protein
VRARLPACGQAQALHPGCCPLQTLPAAASAGLLQRLARQRRHGAARTRLAFGCCWLSPCAATCAAEALLPHPPPQTHAAAERAFCERRQPPKCALGWQGSGTAGPSLGTQQTRAGRRCGSRYPRPSRAPPTPGTPPSRFPAGSLDTAINSCYGGCLQQQQAAPTCWLALRLLWRPAGRDRHAR